jgi:tetratricopeptide (TPR) repeat protein
MGLDKWLGLYEPQYAHPPWALSPLLNPNNFAGYLNLATFVAVGLAMTGRPPAPRWALGIAAAMLFALSILTGSRGGVLALLLGVVLMALAFRAQAHRARRAGVPALPPWLPIAGAGTAGCALFLLGSNDTIWSQLLDETTSKLHMWEWTTPLIRDYRWFGVGRGAYETVSAAYRTATGLVSFQHAENFLADWFAEWGLVVTSGALLCFLWFLRPMQLGFQRHPLPAAALVGVFVLLVQNLVDLGLEVAAVGVAVATVLGSLWGGAIRDRERPSSQVEETATPHDGERANNARQTRRRTRQQPAVAAVGTLVLGGLLMTLVVRTSRPDVLEQRRELHDSVLGLDWANRGKVERTRHAVAAALARHPADSYLPVLGALIAKRTGQNDLPWLNQALRRDPLSARTELLLADSLAARGARTQALGVLRRCANHEPSLASVIAQRATHYTHQLDELELAVPEGPAGVPVLNALAMYQNTPESRPLHDALLARSLERENTSTATRALLVEDLLRDLENPSGPCTGAAKTHCEQQLQEHAKVIERQGVHSVQAVLLRARLLAREGKIDQAVEWLAQQCSEFAADSLCAAQWVSIAAKAKSTEPLEDAASGYLALACSTPDACASAATWIANLYMARGNYELALTKYERAANESPSAEIWLRVADAALRCGRISRAQSALLAARRFGGSDSKLERQLEQARREQLLRGALKQ